MSTYIILALDNQPCPDAVRVPQELTPPGTIYAIGSNCPAYFAKFEGSAAELQAYLGKIRTSISYKKFLIAEVSEISTVVFEEKKPDFTMLAKTIQAKSPIQATTQNMAMAK